MYAVRQERPGIDRSIELAAWRSLTRSSAPSYLQLFAFCAAQAERGEKIGDGRTPLWRVDRPVVWYVRRGWAASSTENNRASVHAINGRTMTSAVISDGRMGHRGLLLDAMRRDGAYPSSLHICRCCLFFFGNMKIHLFYLHQNDSHRVFIRSIQQNLKQIIQGLIQIHLTRGSFGNTYKPDKGEDLAVTVCRS
jgi:hypothetical protein